MKPGSSGRDTGLQQAGSTLTAFHLRRLSRTAMNPMSLLTLPAATLREASLSHRRAAAPHGERIERDLTLAVVLVAIAAGLSLLLGA
jgi:hypothetical protein